MSYVTQLPYMNILTSLHSIFSSISLSKLIVIHHVHSSIETDRTEVLTSLSIG